MKWWVTCFSSALMQLLSKWLPRRLQQHCCLLFLCSFWRQKFSSQMRIEPKNGALNLASWALDETKRFSRSDERIRQTVRMFSVRTNSCRAVHLKKHKNFQCSTSLMTPTSAWHEETALELKLGPPMELRHTKSTKDSSNLFLKIYT